MVVEKGAAKDTSYNFTLSDLSNTRYEARPSEWEADTCRMVELPIEF